MGRKAAINNDVSKAEVDERTHIIHGSHDEIGNLTRMLAAVLEYLSDEDLEEIDIEFLLDDTEGLREWWDRYRERSRKQMEKDIKDSLGTLSVEELKTIYEQIKER